MHHFLLQVGHQIKRQLVHGQKCNRGARLVCQDPSTAPQSLLSLRMLPSPPWSNPLVYLVTARLCFWRDISVSINYLKTVWRKAVTHPKISGIKSSLFITVTSLII